MASFRSGSCEAGRKNRLPRATWVSRRGRPPRSISTSRTTSASCDPSPWSFVPTGLEPWQQSRILKDTVLDFPEFRELSIFDAAGKPLGTSRFGQPTVTIPDPAMAAGRDVYVAPLKQDNDALPTTTIAVRMVPGRPGIADGSSASSRSKSCGGWWIRSRSARPAAQRSSPRTAVSSPTATPTRSGSSHQQRVTAGSNRGRGRTAGEVRPSRKSTTTTRRASRSSRSAR